MIAALLAATAPVAVGTALGLAPTGTRGFDRRMRILALSLAVLVVLVVLVPPTLQGLGWPGLLVMAAAAAIPAGLERIAARVRPEGGRIGVELGFLGLVVHQAVDGAEVAAAFAADVGPWPVAIGIGLHTLPLAAVIVRLFALHDGRVPAAVRGAVLVGATSLGCWVGAAGTDSLPWLELWLPPIVAGTVVHALWHELLHARLAQAAT